MKLADLMKQGALTTAARENSEKSNSKGGSSLINNNIKNSNNSKNSYSCPLDGGDRTETHKPAATAIPATETQPLPYFDLSGDLVIPFDSDPHFHYWAGGQSIAKTEKEIRTWLH